MTAITLAQTATRRWNAIGTSCEIVVSAPALDPAALDQIAGDCLPIATGMLDDLDRACSRFRTDSELMGLRHGTTVRVSPLLSDTIGTALSTARVTDGLVDPTVAGALVATGYDADIQRVRSRRTSSPSKQPSPAPGYWRVHHDPAHREVMLPHGVDLDLGASAKAWAADRIADRVLASGLLPSSGGLLVNLGGDIAVVGERPPGGWRIAVNDGSPATEAPVVAVRAGGLATSSTLLRTWRQGSRHRHHIIDPRTGDTAATTWRSVTVAARTCELANAASTAAVVLGNEAPAWLARRGLHARLRHAAAVRTVGNWPEEERS
jgi:FAD:protein FMN transferase